ncbi:DUF927 domain-containing protein [Streptomyces sp. ET3-23]|uniref:DUF927 domain-containing protein n=1 Tax=Streptomyces sp. ET3-23 TaxID=2885643 RepID=UPI001D0FBC76|nr:DUF927 domain-containing protein [Streptomyces sp. ET3-23]MCC2280274.1 DUF927 domain-containing protein [Streptomyces sp. ET3-23]
MDEEEFAKIIPLNEQREMEARALTEAEAARAAEEEAAVLHRTRPPGEIAAAATAGLEDGPFTEIELFETLFDLEPGVKTPDGYRVNRDGLFQAKTSRGGDREWLRIAWGPIAITKVLRDVDGNEELEISWLSGNRVVRRIVPRRIAAKGRALVEHIGDASFPSVDGKGPALELWLMDFEHVNNGLVPVEPVARWLGWQPDGAFVAYDGDGRRVKPAHETQHGPLAAHHPAGSLEGWQQAVAGICVLEVPRAIVAASLGAALLHPLGLSSFSVDVAARSTRGKTTSLMCGTSVWADPSEKSEAMGSWNTTLSALERRLNLVRGLPTPLDESMIARSQQAKTDLLYCVPKNVGRGREGGWASRLRWETIILSSGEASLLSGESGQGQGASARVLCLTQPPFPDAQTAEAARDGVCAH